MYVSLLHDSVVGGEKRWVSMGGGIVSARAVPLGFLSFSSLVVLHLWASCSSVLLLHSPSVVGGSQRWVRIGGRVVSARDVLLGVPGRS